MIEILGGAFAAGETKTYHINGEYLEILDAIYPVDVMLMDKAGAQLSVMRNSEMSFFSKPSGGFQSVQITSAQAQAVRFFVGSGDAGTRRTAGVVQVVDGNLARTLGNGAFLTSGSVVPSNAANNGAIQLRNRSADKALIVDRLFMVASAACGFNLRLTQAVFPTLQTAALSKLAGGAASDAAEIRSAEGTAWAGAVQLSIGTTGGNQTVTYDGKTPIVIPPGWALAVQDTLNSAHTSTVAFEHVEIQR